MTARRDVRMPLNSAGIRRVLWGVAGLNTVMLIGTYLGHSWDGLHWRLYHLGSSIDLARENNVAAWYSSMLLLAVAGVMLLCFILDRRREATPNPPPVSSRALTFGWLLLSLVFLLLSWDELASLHERTSELPLAGALPRVEGVRTWAAVLLIPVTAVAVGMIAFGWARVRQSRAAFLLLSLGVLLFLSLPLQEHLEGLLKHAAGGDPQYRRPTIYGVLEEGAEVFGSASFLAAGLIYARMRVVQLTAPDRSPAITLSFGLRSIALLGAFLGTGLLFVYLFLPHLMYLGDARGVPQNWYPAVLALLAAGLAGLLARDSGDRAAPALLVLAVFNLALSIDHGSNYAWQESFFTSGRFMPDLARQGVMTALLGGSAVFFFTRVGAPRARVGVAAWTLLLMVALVAPPGPGVRTVLSFAAHLALMAGLVLVPGRSGERGPGITRPASDRFGNLNR